MNQKLTLTLAVLAGFAGGVLSRYLSPDLVHAQELDKPTKISGQMLSLVDKSGAYVGGFMASEDGRIIFSIRDRSRSDMVFKMYDLERKLKAADAPKR